MFLTVLGLVWPSLGAQGAPPVPKGFVEPDAAERVPEALSTVLQRIQAKAVAAHIAYLADPRREGRGLGTRGLEATARYLADLLAKAHLPPLGKDYFQTVPLREIRDLRGGLTLALPGAGAISWEHGRNCVLPELEPQTLAAPLVFAGYGIREEALGHDDFHDLDVKGKIVLLCGGLPAGPAWQTPELKAKYDGPKPEDRYEARIELLDRLGARTVIAIEDGLSQRLAASRPRPEPFFRPAPGVPFSDEPPLVRIAPELAEPLLAALGVDLHRPETVQPKPMVETKGALRLGGDVRPASSRNVISVLAGTDPKLRAEAVVLGAHMDHLGLRGGVLHPGADDNASGVAALIEIARAFASLPVRPHRTVIFAFWTGEEDGKFGSGHYVRHPLWPLAKTRAYINLDMIGHPWKPEELRKLVLDADPGKDGEAFLARLNPVHFAEPGFARWAPDLGPVLAQAGRSSGMALHLDPADGESGGSDYRDFARARVPWIRFFGNFFPEYHESGDKPENLDAVQVQNMARLAFSAAWLLANR